MCVLACLQMRWHARGGQVALDVCLGVAFMHSQGVVWAGEPHPIERAAVARKCHTVLRCLQTASVRALAVAGGCQAYSPRPLPLPRPSPPPADCKPGNVLLTDGWRAKVTDLGTSRLLHGNSTAQSAATPAYAGEAGSREGRVSGLGAGSDVGREGTRGHWVS